MTMREISNMMNGLKLMVADLNDMHNNYDVTTDTEISYQSEIRETINEFNKAQTVWKGKLIPCKKGWTIHYE